MSPFCSKLRTAFTSHSAWNPNASMASRPCTAWHQSTCDLTSWPSPPSTTPAVLSFSYSSLTGPSVFLPQDLYLAVSSAWNALTQVSLPRHNSIPSRQAHMAPPQRPLRDHLHLFFLYLFKWLIKLHPSEFRFPKFSPNTLFCSRIPFGYHVTSCLLRLLLAKTVSQTFLASDDLMVWENWAGTLQNIPQPGFACFSDN